METPPLQTPSRRGGAVSASMVNYSSCPETRLRELELGSAERCCHAGPRCPPAGTLGISTAWHGMAQQPQAATMPGCSGTPGLCAASPMAEARPWVLQAALEVPSGCEDTHEHVHVSPTKGDTPLGDRSSITALEHHQILKINGPL